MLQATSIPVPATIPTTTVPGSPARLGASADGETEIDLSWREPSSDGGSRITGYRIEVSEDRSGWSVLEPDTSRTSHTHRGLPSGSTRHYRVSAINSAGTGPHSNTAHATTDSVDLPGAPQSLSAEADGETEIDLSWREPSSDGGSRITGYRIEVLEDSSGWSVLEPDTSRTSHTHRGLPSGSTRHYRVSAINSAGTGPHSNTAHATTDSVDLPGAPQSLSAEADGETEIDLSWSRPSSDGGSRVTGYRIEVSDSGSNWSVLEADTGSSRTRYTHRGLPGESTRHYRVSAINSAGTGPHSNTAHAITDSVDLPGAPQSLSAEADGETEIDLSWREPSSDGGSRITGYRIEVSDSGSNWSVLEADTGSSRTRYTHRGLPGESTRHYRVSAINSAGTGPHSNTAHATTSAPCEGMTLEQAISKQRISIVRCLVAEGAEVNAKDSDGNPLLRLAIWHQISSIVGILVDAGADVDARDSDGYPLLDLAIRLAYSENVRILVDAGADVNARTAGRYSLLTLAKLIGPAETIRILEDAGATEE